MLVAILNMDQNVMYVTKNSAPREVYRKKLTDGKYRKAYIDNLFKGSGSFTEAISDDFDCLIVDEAHRLNEKSGMFQNLGENQVKEIINAAKTSIFFVDDFQMVTTKDIGSTNEIKSGVDILMQKYMKTHCCHNLDVTAVIHIYLGLTMF